MKLDEMGVIGRQVKIKDSSPSHPGEIGTIVTMTTERVFVRFADGAEEWISNAHVVGTRKAESFLDGDDYPLTEMAAKKQCDKCGKTMTANHYWYKGGWKCKKSSGDSKPAEKKLKTAARLGLTGPSDGKKCELSQSMKDANEKAANERQNRFIAQLEKDINEREAKKKTAKEAAAKKS